jgi:hypothetical protein
MPNKWMVSAVIALLAFSGTAIAAKPERVTVTAAAAPSVVAAKLDYLNLFVIVEGENLSPTTAAATFAGVSLLPDPSSTGNELKFAFTDELSAVIDERGNYVLTITTDGGSFTLTAFVPWALASPPPPPGADCPCSPEWDSASTTASPDGFSGLVPYCSEDNGNWVTVQFYDEPVGNYWVMWTQWDAGTVSGFCELYIDGPYRALDTETQFNACAAYLRGIVTAWGDQGNACLF